MLFVASLVLLILLSPQFLILGSFFNFLIFNDLLTAVLMPEVEVVRSLGECPGELILQSTDLPAAAAASSQVSTSSASASSANRLATSSLLARQYLLSL